MKRKKWEKLNGYYENDYEVYSKNKSCYDCRRMFDADTQDRVKMCGQMLLDGVKDDAEVFKDSSCKHLFAWIQTE
jgi:hypothetical protein